MNIDWIINIFIFIPIVGFVLSLLVNEKKELLLSRIAFSTAGLQLITFSVFAVYWLLHGHPTLNLKEILLYQTKEYEFLVDFYFDKISAVYLFVGALLTFLITIYSRYYLHRESGYKRFFNTILFFFIGYNLTVLSGNFETLFIGWEVLGISSFLLIAFYRDRYMPVRNAVKVFSVYRIGDVGILLAMWASHHLWHENITFMKLNNYELVHDFLLQHSSIGIFISVMILIAAAAKSAQLPFSSWLPRAMEGPTPSSAIFYGSLSVHFGVFLLLRTYPFWEHQFAVRVLIALVGISSAIVASLIARVQSSIKSQIAYASIAQIGLIFVEVAAGLETLALIHFAGNAFLRTYQLLVSPSVVSYLIREQFYHFKPSKPSVEDSLPKRIENTFYLLALKEWNLDKFMNHIVFSPLKKLGHKLDFLSMRNVLYYFVPVYVVGIALKFFEVQLLSETVEHYMATAFSFIGLLMVLRSFGERKSPMLAWLLMVLNHFSVVLAVSFNEHFDFSHVLLYMSGVLPAAIVGFLCLQRLQKSEAGHFDLNQYFGHVYEHPKLGLVFLLACLGLMGFPISPSFIGEDLLFTHIHENQFLLAFFESLAYIMGGIAVIRIYARLFLGPHVKTYHETPYKTS